VSDSQSLCITIRPQSTPLNIVPRSNVPFLSYRILYLFIILHQTCHGQPVNWQKMSRSKLLSGWDSFNTYLQEYTMDARRIESNWLKRFDFLKQLLISFNFFRCVICMIEFVVGDCVRYLPCMHTYHSDCIDDWLMRSFTCPSCMEPVDAALLVTYETSWGTNCPLPFHSKKMLKVNRTFY